LTTGKCLDSKKILKDLQAIAKIHTIKDYLCFCLDEEDSFVDEINVHIKDNRHSQVFVYMYV